MESKLRKVYQLLYHLLSKQNTFMIIAEYKDKEKLISMIETLQKKNKDNRLFVGVIDGENNTTYYVGEFMDKEWRNKHD